MITFVGPGYFCTARWSFILIQEVCEFQQEATLSSTAVLPGVRRLALTPRLPEIQGTFISRHSPEQAAWSSCLGGFIREQLKTTSLLTDPWSLLYIPLTSPHAFPLPAIFIIVTACVEQEIWLEQNCPKLQGNAVTSYRVKRSGSVLNQAIKKAD